MLLLLARDREEAEQGQVTPRVVDGVEEGALLVDVGRVARRIEVERDPVRVRAPPLESLDREMRVVRLVGVRDLHPL